MNLKHLYLTVLIFGLINNVIAQSDTTIYFSLLGKQLVSKDDAKYKITIKKVDENTYVENRKSINDNSSNAEQVRDIRKINDSTFIIKSSNSNFELKRIFIKIDSGYIIKEIRINQFDIGYSKLIFPLIKSGTWYTYLDSTKLKLTEEYYNNNEMTGNLNWNKDGSKYFSNVFITTETPIGYGDGEINKIPKILAKYLKYPNEAAKSGIKGKVIVQFVVLEDGTIDGYRILRGVHPLLDNEAIRALKEVPSKWRPGTIGGKIVKAFAVVPVVFNLD